MVYILRELEHPKHICGKFLFITTLGARHILFRTLSDILICVIFFISLGGKFYKFSLFYEFYTNFNDKLTCE